MIDCGRRPLRGLLLLLACAVVLPVDAQGSEDAAVAIAQSAQWRALLHWEGRQSRVDAAAFFVHPQGKVDALLELGANYRALRDEPQMRCRFPARWQFLQTQYADLAGMPTPYCPQFEQWRGRLSPQSVTLVFAAAYLGNPSSMFGHTFLRLDDDGHPLLAWAVNFAAQTQEAKGLTFAWKGMTGGYPGRFGLAPYYDKVTEYARLEQRSLWEYRLSLEAAEIDFLLAHLWEMRDATFDYYFFQENCSFQLLALLQAVRPDLPLTQGFALFAAPIDTLRRLQQYGLVEAVQRRPAQQVQLRAKAQSLSEPAQAALQWQLMRPAQRLALAQWPVDPAERASWFEVLGSLAEAYQASSSAPALWSQLQSWALQQRSRISTPPVPLVLAPMSSPDTSHFSQRLSLSWLRSRDASAAAELAWRPVLHDALDGAKGLPLGSEISVLDTRLRWHNSSLRLQQLQVFGVRALPLRDAWFSPLSWQLAVGYERDEWSDHAYGMGRAGVGGTWLLAPQYAARATALLRGTLLLAKAGQRGVESALDMRLQGHWRPDWPWQLQLEWFRRDGHLVDEAQAQAVLSLGQQWQIKQNFALRAGAQRHLSLRKNLFKLTVAHYF